MADILPGDNRPPVYYDDNMEAWIIRASAIGGCLFELIAAGQGLDRLDPPAFLLRAFAEGHELEPRAIAELEAQGWVNLGSQQEAHLKVSDDIYVRCHPDMIGLPPHANPELTGVEVKWLSDANWRKAARHGVASVVDEYAWQVSVMMYALGTGTKDDGTPTFLPFMWAYGNKGFAPDKETGVKAYCEDEGTILYEWIYEPPIPLEQIRERAKAAIEGVRGDFILEAGRTCDKPEHFPCLYRHFLDVPATDTDGGQETEFLLLDGERAKEVDTLVREYLFAKGQADELKKRSEMARDALLQIGEGYKAIETETWKVPIVGGRGQGKYELTDMPWELRERIKAFWKQGKPYNMLRGIKRKDA